MKTSLARPNLRNLLKIAFPMIVSQGAETVMLVFDRLFLSKVSTLHLSAAMSGGLSSFVFSSFFMGLTGYTNAVAAQYYGAGQKQNCALTCAQGMRLSLMLYPLMLLLIFPVKLLFIKAGHGTAQVNLEFSYYSALMLGSVFSVLRATLGGFFLGIGKTRLVMVSNLIGMLVNIPINYVLIFGKLGFPALGVTGAAIGTICGSFVITLLLFLFYISERINSVYRTRNNFRIDKAIMKKLLRFGTHAGLESFLNVFAFNIFILLMHSYSTTVAAAVTITFNYDLIAFIPMIGIGVATTAIVGQQLGAGRKREAEKAAYLAMKVAWSYAAIMMALFISIPGRLSDLYASSFTPQEYGDIIPLARLMLRLAAVYTLADATQLVFAGALRGAGDTKWVMRTSGILHYIMASLAVVMIKVLKIPPQYVWVMFIAFIISLGVSMFLRFRFGKWKKIKMIESGSGLYSILASCYEEFFPPDGRQYDLIESLIKPDATMLDIGCATGALAEHFRQKGHQTTGLDPESEMVRTGKIKYPLADLLDVSFQEYLEEHMGQSFGCITCLGNTLPHIGDYDQIHGFISMAYETLEDDGVFVAEFVNFERFNASGEQLPPLTGSSHILRRSYSGSEVFTFTVTLTDREDKKMKESAVQLHPLSADNLKRMLEDTGFSSVEIWQDYEKTAYTPEAGFVVVAAKK